MEQIVLGGHFQATSLLKSDGGIETFRGVDLDQGEPIVIKKTPSSALTPSTRMRIEHEAEVLHDLAGRISCLAPPIGVGQQSGEFFLVAPWVPGESLAERLRRGRLGTRAALDVARGLMRALHELHERGVIHRDIKPANIILELESAGRVTLVGVGLARTARLDPWALDEPAGTIAYISPEQAGLIHRDVGERADLYSAGVVLYECLAGRPPFVADTAGEVLRQHLTLAPPELRSLGLSLPRALDAVIQRLLRKDPRDRYQSAAAVLVDIEGIIHALDEGQRDPALVIGASDRRRTLTEPAFVGRESEVRALDGELDHAKDGEARLVSVEAESGAGKTRLLAELAVHAAQRGAWVLRGQATSLGVQRPLQLFDGVAQGILARVREDASLPAQLRDALGDHRAAACIALPSLCPVLTPGQTELAALNEAFGEARIVPALTALLDALATRERLAVVIFDDCQSADDVSLKIIAAWQRSHGAGSPAHELIALGYRSDEVDVEHPLRQLTESLHVELPALARDEVRRLAESMAGELPAAAIELVERLSQGNPFVAIAALEGLVEGGALVDTETRWDVDPGAMATAQASGRGASSLARRLERLPPSVLELLSACAILGKTFDLALAADLIGRPIGDAMNDFLVARRRHLVFIDPQGERFSFAHDRIRTRLIERLAASERRRLHRLAALRIEAEGSRGHVSQADLAFDLAYHFDEAGDAPSALPYALEAASKARARHAFEIAERQYRIAERGLEGASVEQRRTVTEALADVLMLRGRYDEAEVELHRARSLATKPLAKAAIEGKLGELAFKRGRVDEAAHAIERALALLGFRMPTSALAIAMVTAFQAMVQVLHTLFPRIFLGRRGAERRDGDLLAARLFSRLAYAYWFTRGQVATFLAHLSELNLAELHPPSRELGQAYSEHALGMTGLPRILFRRGDRYAERGLAIRRALGDVAGEAQSLSFHGMLRYAAGDYSIALARFREASRVLRRVGDLWEANNAGVHIAYCLYRMGALREAVEECRRVHRDGVEIGDAHAMGLIMEPWAKATGGAAPADLVEAALASSRNDAQTRESVLQADALRWLREGDVDRAIETFSVAERVVHEAKLKSEYVSYLPVWRGYALRLAAERIGGTVVVPRPERLRAAEREIRRGVRTARRYRGNLPMALREKALLLARRGALVRAQRMVDRSIAEAEALGTRLEWAQSRFVGAHLQRLRGIAGADEEIARARALIHELGGEFVLTLGQGTVEGAPPVTLSLADRFGTVVDSGRRVASALTPDDIYIATCAAGASLLRGQSATVLRLESQTEESIEGARLQILCRAGSIDDAAISQTLVQQAFEEQRTVVWSEAHDILANMRSAMCTPIVVAGKTTSCLYVTHSLLGALFGDDERHLADYIAALAGASLEKADAFAQLHALSISLEQRVKERTTELRAANAELDANLRRLRETQEQLLQTGKMAAIGTLVAGLSHEINNPVAVILAQAQNILRRLPSEDPMRPPMEAIARQAKRCADLVRTMLDFTRKSSGERSEASVEGLVHDIVELSRTKAKTHDVTLDTVVASELPMVQVSRTEIESAVLNLVSNAIDASKRGDVVRLQVEPRAHDGRPGVEISVEDRGSGIPPEVMPRIFDPFYTTKPVGQGTGLGLSLALQIVEGHGGKLSAESGPSGTTMRLWLPAGGAA